MHAAHKVNGPSFAHAILTTEERLVLLPATQEWKHDDSKAEIVRKRGCLQRTANKDN
jgi:hypothetical protein